MSTRMWLEMSQDPDHGGSGWGFGKCLWSPSEKKKGGHWTFWQLLLEVKAGDTVMHWRGRGKRAALVGFSIADTDGYSTTQRPALTKAWSYARTFYRVPLRDYIAFAEPIPLKQFFSARESALRSYFAMNKQHPRHARRHIFYVIQAGRLQCLNGAYLSEVDDALEKIILDRETLRATRPQLELRVGEQMRRIEARLGQQRFAEVVKDNFGHRCCFPDCPVDDTRLLVGSHIARWADAPNLRGSLTNGPSLCALHDRTFELGMFTVTKDGLVFVNTKAMGAGQWARAILKGFHNKPIRRGAVMPSVDALSRHWERIGCSPTARPGGG